ncbi:hypothetical protein KCU89_g106, partial [Aureobasidium melanogenum]
MRGRTFTLIRLVSSGRAIRRLRGEVIMLRRERPSLFLISLRSNLFSHSSFSPSVRLAYNVTSVSCFSIVVSLSSSSCWYSWFSVVKICIWSKVPLRNGPSSTKFLSLMCRRMLNMESLDSEPPAARSSEVEMIESSGVGIGSGEHASVESGSVEPCGSVVIWSCDTECINPSGSGYMASFDADDEAFMIEDEFVERHGWKEDRKMESASVRGCGTCLFTTCESETSRRSRDFLTREAQEQMKAKSHSVIRILEIGSKTASCLCWCIMSRRESRGINQLEIFLSHRRQLISKRARLDPACSDQIQYHLPTASFPVPTLAELEPNR